jgi:hypothetical protein
MIADPNWHFEEAVNKMEKWRPEENWDKKIAEKFLDQYREALPLSICIEAVVKMSADAMLEAICQPNCLVSSTLSKSGKGYLVFIPDDPQPKVKEQLMICPKAKTCSAYHYGCEKPHGVEHHFSGNKHCLFCVPYEPESATTWSKTNPCKYLNGETRWFGVWQIHKATKHIEAGYFCPICGMQVPTVFQEGNSIRVRYGHDCPDPGGRGIAWSKE